MGNKSTPISSQKSPPKKKATSLSNSGIKASSSGSSLVPIEHNPIIGNMMKRIFNQSDDRTSNFSRSQPLEGFFNEVESRYQQQDDVDGYQNEGNGYSRFWGSQSPSPSLNKGNAQQQQSVLLFSGKSSATNINSPENNFTKSPLKSNSHSPIGSPGGSMINSVSENVGAMPIRENNQNNLILGMPDAKKNGAEKEKMFTNFQTKFFELSNDIIYVILSFIIDQYNQLILVSPFWYFKIHEVLDDVFIKVDNNFIQKNLRLLTLKKTYLSYTPFKVSKKSYRLDRNIIAEILPYYRGKTVIMGFTYNLKGNKRKEKMHAEYKFDVIKEATPRTIWIYKEVCKHNFDAINYGFIQAIMPVCVGDNIKLAINFYNLSGLIDIDSIEWHEPVIHTTPTLPKEINPKTAQTVDKNRICEIEEIQHDWSLYEYFENKEKKRLDLFGPQLVLKETLCAGVDIVTSKMLYTAGTAGKVKEAINEMEVNITVIPPNEELTTEIKRTGLYADLENHLEIRPGDSLLFYLSSGD